MNVLVALFDTAVVGIAIWLLFGTSLESRAPDVPERARSAVVTDQIARRRIGGAQ